MENNKDMPSNIVGSPDLPNGAVVGIEDRRGIHISLAHRHRRHHRHHRKEPDADIRGRDLHDEND